MCTAAIQQQMQDQQQQQGKQPADDSLQISNRAKAEDIPLGDGLAGTARTSLLSRRERLRQAIDAADQ